MTSIIEIVPGMIQCSSAIINSVKPIGHTYSIHTLVKAVYNNTNLKPYLETPKPNTGLKAITSSKTLFSQPYLEAITLA